MKFHSKETNRTFKYKSSLLIKIILMIAIIAGGGCFLYVNDYYKADEVALSVAIQTQDVEIKKEKQMMIFRPTASDPTIGYIFYPGGKVEYTAYIPMMNLLAANGITCVLLKMPFHLAVFDVNGANRAIKAVPEISSWYVGGHSLGGAMSSSFASKNLDQVQGVILFGSYPSSDLSHSSLSMLSLIGTNDQVINQKKFEEAKSNAPKHSTYVQIMGGNHAYFGNYGEQAGDGVATISASKQQEVAVAAILDFIVNDSVNHSK